MSEEGAEQSCRMSFVESVTNVVIGFLLALATQIAIFPLFGLVATLGDNVAIGGIFTIVSVVRSFALRRLFEALRVGQERRENRV